MNPDKKPFSAVIFDMDGVLLDSEAIALRVFEECCQACGLPFEKSVYTSIIGTNAAKTREIFLAHYGDDFPFDRLDRCWEARYNQEALEKAVPLKPGVKWLLDRLRSAALPLGVATSTDRKKAFRKLEMAGIIQSFDAIVTGEQVEKSKPEPEIYLEAAKRLKVNPGDCLAIEDSENGVRAAFRADMTVIQIPDLIKPSPEILALGHTVMGSLFEVGKWLSIETPD